jgi:hypothetical protein
LAGAVPPADAGGDTVVIQVGDLIDRGPDSAGVLALVQQRLERSPRRWIQLIGNHESQYLGGAPFWPQRLADADAQLLATWWWTDRLRVAAAVRTAHGEEFLITHAGLTVDAWREVGGPVTAGTAADLLNTRPEDLLWHQRGPLWAEAGPQVYQSWLRSVEPMPFGQIHPLGTAGAPRRHPDRLTAGARSVDQQRSSATPPTPPERIAARAHPIVTWRYGMRRVRCDRVGQ